MNPTLIDSTLFHDANNVVGLPAFGITAERMEQFLPARMWPGAMITDVMPDESAIIKATEDALAGGAKNLLIDEWRSADGVEHPAWGMRPDNIQWLMDRKANIFEVMRKVGGKSLGIWTFNEPLPGERCASNFNLEKNAAAYMPNRWYIAARSTYDVIGGKRAKGKSRYLRSITGCACGCYWKADPDNDMGLSPADSFEEGVRGTLDMAKRLGIPAMILTRINSYEPPRDPVPMDVSQRAISIAKDAKVPLGIWDDKLPDQKAPLLALLRKMYPTPRPVFRPPVRTGMK